MSMTKANKTVCLDFDVIKFMQERDLNASEYINSLILKEMNKTPNLHEALQSMRKSQWKCPICKMFYKIGGRPLQALCPRCDVDMEYQKESTPEPPKEDIEVIE